MNKVFLIGRLTKDPELKFTPQNGTAVTQFTLAVNKRFKKENGPTADFINIVAWGKIAEHCSNYLNKGSQASVAGRLEIRSYQAQDGTTRYTTEVVADEVEFLDPKKSKNEYEDMTPIEDSADMPF